MMFPLSDATSLLLRLEMDGKERNLKDRWRELGQAYMELDDSFNNVFYDYHAVVATLFGGQRVTAEKVLDSIREQSASADANRSYNCDVARRVGVALAEATVAFVDGDYAETVRRLNPVRFECQELLGASHTQKDVIDLMLLSAAVRSGRRRLAERLFAERIAWCPMVDGGPVGRSLHRLRIDILGRV
jgi:hypothetical protein